MTSTIVEKILAEKSGLERVSPGEIITCKVDWLMLDSFDGHLIEAIHEIGLSKVFDPQRVVVIHDHEVPPSSSAVATMYANSRKMISRFGIANFFDMSRHGICHQFFVEQGFALPGQLAIGNDSHSTTYGALNMASRGVLQEIIYVLAKGELWFKVPATVSVSLNGKLARWISSKDVIIYLCHRFGFRPFLNRAIEYRGSALKDLSIESRMVLSNMAVDLGAEFALFEFDDIARRFLNGRARQPFKPVRSDPGAAAERSIYLELGEIQSLVAGPHNLFKVTPARDLSGVRIDQSFLGSCTNGRMEDMEVAASILRGRKIANHVRMIVTPASQAVFREMASSGLMQIFVDAGAIVTNSTCGACMGLSMGVLGDGEVCIASSSRNFKGRMGSPSAEVYIASPATVAASAVVGAITDPAAI